MLTVRGPCTTTDRIPPEPDSRGRGEGHVVGAQSAAGASPSTAARRPSRTARTTSTSAPRSRSESGSTSRGLRRPRHQHPPGRLAGQRLDEALGDERSGTTSAMTPVLAERRRRARSDRRDSGARQRARVQARPLARRRTGAGRRSGSSGKRGRSRSTSAAALTSAARSGSPGASTTSAPSARSRAASPLACARARVTATLPAAGAACRRASRAASRAPRPRRTRRSRAHGSARPAPAPRSSASVADDLRWPASVPRSITRRRLVRRRGRRRAAARRSRRSRRTPMYTTSVPGNAASACQSSADSGFAGSSWPVTNATALAASRCVTGIPAYAGAATPAVTPGTTSNGMPAARSASASSPPRPNTNGSPPFSRTTVAPRRAVFEQQPLDLALRDRRPPPSLPAYSFSASGRAPLERARRDQPVVDDHVGRGDQLERSRGQQPGIARTGADQVDGQADRAARAPSAPAASIRAGHGLAEPAGSRAEPRARRSAKPSRRAGRATRSSSSAAAVEQRCVRADRAYCRTRRARASAPARR